LSIDRFFVIIFDPFETISALFGFHEGSIVVASDESNIAVEAFENMFDTPLGREGEVSKVVDGIALLNFIIPTINQTLIHFFLVLEWTLAVFDDVRMTEMSIASEKDRHFNGL
jgi:hypothetical protein